MMFVLHPPPPRYTTTPGYGASPYLAAQPMPILETNNTINRPTGPEYTFSVGEGTYTLREDIFLATPPPHPSEAPVTNPNPLATTPVPPTAGTKLSLVVLKSRASQSHLYRESGLSLPQSEGSDYRKSVDSNVTPSENGAAASGVPAGLGLASAPATGKDGKNKKPKNNIAKSNSSFVSRIITHENMQKRLQDRKAEDLMVFANINRAFNWLDLGASSKQEPLSKILFTKAHALCHDVNQVTKSSTHLDVIMGFSSGDIIWFEPMSQKYARLNKNGVINNSAVTDIRWVPGSDSLFLAAHESGALVCYDKDREDAVFSPETPANVIPGDANQTNGVTASPITNGATQNGEAGVEPSSSWKIGKSYSSKNQKTNPVASWTVSRLSITSFAFSPSLSHIAVVSEDGSLRIIDFHTEALLDVYTSYYGGLLCVCWSPDGRYVLTGGQDDLVSIWSFRERRIVARCQGHHSWVTAVAFDPWRCDDRTYRFGSVGEDGRLLLWDFSVGMLHRPKATAIQHRGSLSGQQQGRLRAESLTGSVAPSSLSRLRSNSNVTTGYDLHDGLLDHPVEPRSAVAMLPPIMSKIIDPEPLSALYFREDSIVTTCRDGHIRTWDRPHVGKPAES